MIIEKSNLVEHKTILVNGKITEETTIDNINKLAKFFDSSKRNFINNLKVFINKDKIKLEIIDFDPQNDMWDGTLLIHLNGISTYDLVNYIIGCSNADEISMNNDNTVRLWWD
jgi:hypothetical protein